MQTFVKNRGEPQKKETTHLGKSKLVTPGSDNRDHPLFHSQDSSGNLGTRRSSQPPHEEPKFETAPRASPRFGFDFSRINVRPPVSGTIQTKLAIRQPGDEYEQEADHVSEMVMRTAEPDGLSIGNSGEQGPEQQPLKVKRIGGCDLEQTPAPPIVQDLLHSPGRPLDAPTRAFMEPRFGHDFSRVRVHSGAAAEQSAHDLDAHAYTTGNNMVFGSGQFAPNTHQGRSLIAHELTHVVQQGGVSPTLQRQPKQDKSHKNKGPKMPPKKSEQEARSRSNAERVHELKRDNESWKMTIEGFVDAESLGPAIWPSGVPSGVTIALTLAAEDAHSQRGWFALNGLTFGALKTMEPSFAKLFSDHGLEDETKVSAEVQTARAAFRKRHDGHTDADLNNIDAALLRVTKRNPELLIAYYNHYSDHELTNESSAFDHHAGVNFDKESSLDNVAGDTAYGNTVINPRVLDLKSKFPTDDPMSLLAGTLIHEYVHTPQGGGAPLGSTGPKEAKAYGVEVFFSSRMGDQKRMDVIYRMHWAGSDEIIFRKSEVTMRMLYEIIDQGGPAAKDAKDMSVEFISKNSEDFGPKLKAFIATVP